MNNFVMVADSEISEKRYWGLLKNVSTDPSLL